jgi:hypothetical protein
MQQKTCHDGQDSEKDGRRHGYVLATMISRMRTMRPRIPPPVPYCHELPWWDSVVSGAAAARQNSESWRNVLRAD